MMLRDLGYEISAMLSSEEDRIDLAMAILGGYACDCGAEGLRREGLVGRSDERGIGRPLSDWREAGEDIQTTLEDKEGLETYILSLVKFLVEAG